MTDVDLCNQALRIVGHQETISSLDTSDGSAANDACIALYEQVRDHLLGLHAWNFAIARAATYDDYNADTTYAEDDLVVYNGTVYKSLADSNSGNTPDGAPAYWSSTSRTALSEADWPVDDWDKAFTLPTSCLRVLHANEDRIRVLHANEDRIGFAVEGGQLLTNYADVSIAYIQKETDVSLYPAAFAKAVYYSLAVELAHALARSADRALEIEKHLQGYVLPDAVCRDALEGAGSTLRVSGWLESRF